MGCREASSSLVARSRVKQDIRFGCPVFFVRRRELAASTHARSAFSIRGRAGFPRIAIVLTSSISLRFACRQTFGHFAARPFPTETASLGFGGAPLCSWDAGKRVRASLPAPEGNEAAAESSFCNGSIFSFHHSPHHFLRRVNERQACPLCQRLFEIGEVCTAQHQGLHAAQAEPLRQLR